MKRSIMGTLLAIVMMSLVGSTAFAYPDKPVSFVVPWPPGDLEDVLTRMIADEFQEMYDVPAAVVNKPGGGGGPFPGSVGVAMGPADGSQIGSFTMAIPVVGPNVGIEALKEDTFEPVGSFLTYPFVIATKKGVPYKSMEELAAYAKDNKVSLGHFGGKAIPTRVTKALAKTLDFQYAMDAAFDALDCNTLASGDADVINTTLQLVLPCIDDITVLASITGKRIPLTPDSPTVGEIAPELKFVLWNGLFVKKGTSQEVKDKVAAAAKKALDSPKAKKLAADTGAEVYWMGAEETDARIESSRKGFKRLVELNK